MSPLETLKRIMLMWPKNRLEGDESTKNRFEGLITKDFNYADFANVANGEFSIFSKVLIVGNQAKILVYDSKTPVQPNLAVLVKGDDEEWRLKLFWFQCNCCFGTGVDGKDPCDVCGATGWGLLSLPDEKSINEFFG